MKDAGKVTKIHREQRREGHAVAHESSHEYWRKVTKDFQNVTS